MPLKGVFNKLLDFLTQYKQLFTETRLRNALLSSSTVALAQQLCGSTGSLRHVWIPQGFTVLLILMNLSNKSTSSPFIQGRYSCTTAHRSIERWRSALALVK